jgi:signal transduction histidine kinase
VTLLVVVLGWLMAVAGGTVGGPWTTLAVAGLLGAIATVRATQAAARGRPVVTPVVVGGLSYAAVLVVAAANLLVDLDVDLTVAIAYDGVVALVAIGLGVGLLLTAPTDDTVADVLVGIGTGPDGGRGLEPQLRRVLGDPGLTIGYWAPDRGRYVDEHDQEVEARDHRASTTVTEDGRPVAVIFHDPVSLVDPGLLEGATAAVRLTATNAAMRREATQRVARLAEARRRIVEAADVEAEALARRLVQGPQARLRNVARALSKLETGGCTDSATTAAVRRELDAAHHELQELARGVRPRDLTDGGLARAIPSLATGRAVATAVSVEVGRLDPAIEAGLYFFCAEALANAAKHASASLVRVAVWPEPGAVVAEVVDDGVGGADPSGSGLRGLKDRIGALGGTLELAHATPRGVRLLARVPTEVGNQR